MARGFTLLELMIVVVIIAILASLAYYNYGRYAFRTRRADGHEILMRLAAAEERFFTNFNVYTTNITGSPTATPPGLGLSNQSEKGFYSVTVGLTNNNLSYTLDARPQSDQANDASTCGDLTLTDTGVKSQTGPAPTSNGNCW